MKFLNFCQSAKIIPKKNKKILIKSNPSAFMPQQPNYVVFKLLVHTLELMKIMDLIASPWFSLPHYGYCNTLSAWALN
jgi:hypothetical protein